MGWKFNPLFGTGLTPTGGGTPGDGILADGSVPFTGDQSMGGNQLTNVGTPGAGTDAANKDYVDDNAANVTLSNLTSPTAINQDLIFDTGANVNIQTINEATTTKNIAVFTGIGDTSGSIHLYTGDGNVISGAIDINTGPDGSGTADSGAVTIYTGDTTTGQSGGVVLKTGPSSAGDSGGVEISTGTATGTRGKIQLKDGSEGTAGEVWTSTDTNGSGEWAAPSSAFDILAFTSAATIGGAVQETVAVTGLLTSDTVLAVTQKTMGGATRTSLPLIQWNVGSNDNITLDWVADPGVGAVVVVSVKR